jgi:site-specific recombinase XerD
VTLIEGVDGAQLLVHGKGQTQRVVPISDSLADLLRQGAAVHTPGMPGKGMAVPSVAEWRTSDRHSYVGLLVGRALPDGYSMHTLRHRFSSRAYRGTRNLHAEQVLLGHSSIATTERYTAVDDSEIRAGDGGGCHGRHLVDRDVKDRPFDAGAGAIEMPPLAGIRRESTGAHGRA